MDILQQGMTLLALFFIYKKEMQKNETDRGRERDGQRESDDRQVYLSQSSLCSGEEKCLSCRGVFVCLRGTEAHTAFRPGKGGTCGCR